MEPFEYVVVLTSLILGLGIAQILTSLADILSNLGKVKLGYAHCILIFNIFIMHVNEWWVSFNYAHQVEEWTLWLVLILLLYPILLFLFARMLFPTGLRGHETDLASYYEEQWPGLFMVLFLIAAISLVQNVLVAEFQIMEQLPQIVLMVATGIFIVFQIGNRWAHIAFLGLQALGWVIYIITDTSTLMNM